MHQASAWRASELELCDSHYVIGGPDPGRAVELGHHEEIAHAAGAELGPHAMHRAHATARAAILKIVERGRREGTFRTDVTPGWQVTICLALIHAAAEEVRTGAIESNAALDLLFATIIDLLAGPNC